MTLTSRKHERGASLIVGLVLLLVATIVVFAGVRGTQMQERMASNFNNKAISHMAAEAGASRVVDWAVNLNDLTAIEDLTAALEAEFGTETQVDAQGRGFFRVVNVNEVEGWVEVLGLARPDADGPVLARSSIRVDRVVGTSDRLGPSAPAAISCFGGPCSIDYGTGGGNPKDPNVSGFDYDPPDDFYCTGDACRQYTYNEPGDGESAKPAIYLDEGGTVVDGNNVVFLGEPDPVVSNDGEPDPWTEDPDTWPVDTTNSVNLGTRNEPVYAEMIAPGFIDRGAGVLVINGTDAIIDIVGTSYYEGLILIKNCGTITASGTPHVYGAIIIDATGCAQPYDPFKGNGRPTVLYSSGTLANADSIFFGLFQANLWREVITDADE